MRKNKDVNAGRSARLKRALIYQKDSTGRRMNIIDRPIRNR